MMVFNALAALCMVAVPVALCTFQFREFSRGRKQR